MTFRTTAPPTIANDQESMFQVLRRSLLMQVRWIEDHPATDTQMTEFLSVIRRSHLQLVRAIETQYHIAPKRRKVKTRRR